MPIELLYTDSELVRIQKNLLFQTDLSKDDLGLLSEINTYFKRPFYS